MTASAYPRGRHIVPTPELLTWWEDLAGHELDGLSWPIELDRNGRLSVVCPTTGVVALLRSRQHEILRRTSTQRMAPPLLPLTGGPKPITELHSVLADLTLPILVTGSRKWPLPEVVEDALLETWHDATQTYGTGIHVIHGACPTGADAHAAAWTRANNIRACPFEADWLSEGRAAGPLRNQRMVDQRPVLCLAFFTDTSVGTADCVNRALEACIPVRRFTA